MRKGGGGRSIYKGEYARKSKRHPRPEVEPIRMGHVFEHLIKAARGVARKWFSLSLGQKRN